MEKKRNVIIILSALLIAGIASVYAYATDSTESMMSQAGSIFHKYTHTDTVKNGDEVYARGKGGAVVTTDDINQAAKFFIASGMDEATAKHKAISYSLQHEALYQKAIQEGYSVTDDEVYAYLDKLKKFINTAENKSDAKALIAQFDSPKEYWQHEFEVYKKDLPIIKYSERLKKEFIAQSQSSLSGKSKSSAEADPMDGWNSYYEKLKSKLALEENYKIRQKIKLYQSK